jgi:uncharacterized membrane protein YeaQ/YmgE (transglycosylase-associated protein family)
MDILLWILFGGISGWITSLIMKTDMNQGTLEDVVLGIVGAVVGGYLFNTFGAPGVTGFNLYSLIVAVIGAVVIILVGRILRGQKA